jgi:hypothetical protein
MRPLTTGEIVRETFRFYGTTLATVVSLALIAHLPLLFLTGIASGGAPPDPLPAMALLALTLLLIGIVVNAIYLALLAAAAGRTEGVVRCLRWSMGRPTGTVLLGYMVTNLVTHLGLLLFIVPGLLAGGLLAVTVPAVVIEKKGLFAAIARSVALLRQDWLKGIGVFAFGMFFSELLPFQLLLAMQMWVGRGPFSPVLTALLAAITMPLALTANLLLYLSQRAGERAGSTAEALRAELLQALPKEE